MTKINDYINKFAELSFNNANDWLKFADLKVSFLLSVSLALFTGSILLLPTALNNLTKLFINPNRNVWILSIVLGIIVVIYFFLILIVIFNFIAALSPITKPKSLKKSLLFFGEIASMTPEEYKKRLLSATEDTVLDELVDQTYNNSAITSQKYSNIKRTVIILRIALLVGIVYLFIGTFKF